MLLAIDFVRAGSGGAKEYMANMISYIQKEKHVDFILVLSSVQVRKLRESLVGIKYITCPFENIFVVMLWQAFILPITLRRRNVHSLLVTDASTTIFFKKQIVMHRDMLAFDSQIVSCYLRRKIYRKYIRLLIIKYLQLFNLWYAKKPLFLTEHARDTVGQYIVLNNPLVIAHGIREEYFRAPTDSSSDETVVTYVSNSAPYKHHMNLVKAFEMLQNSSAKKLRLKLVGALSGDDSTYLERYVREHNYDWLIALPFLDQEKVLEELRNSQFYVFLSSCECMPNTLLQKMAQGKDILCSNVRPMTDIMPEESVFCDPHDVSSIVLGISSILETSNTNYENSVNREIAAKYTWDKSFSSVIAAMVAL